MSVREPAEPGAEGDRSPRVEYASVDNGAGHELSIKRTSTAARAGARPIVLVPGYGMNSFIFGFHPRGPSIEAYLAARGLVVYSCDLRGQGRSKRPGAAPDPGLGDLAIDDLGAVLEWVAAREASAFGGAPPAVNLVGCSMGAALAFAHVAVRPDARVHALVSLAGAVTWRKAHPVVKLAFASPALAGLVRVQNTRAIARRVFPAVARVAPGLLAPYLRVGTTDISRAHEMVETVEDPSPRLNREIAEWVRRGALVVRGVDVSRAIRSMRHPFLCVVAAQDGIVPPETARSPHDDIASDDKELVIVGDASAPFAHGDLFVGDGAQEKVFEPVARFLLRN
jgi:pimeloyl-ACP methyl ester carboxylesterase